MIESTNAILTDVKFYAHKALDGSSQAAKLILDLPTTVGSTLSRLWLEHKPLQISEVIRQTQTHGSALLKTNEGDLFIEITQTNDGRNSFKASGAMISPTEIVQSDTDGGLVLWNVKVSEFLARYRDNTDSISYGVSVKDQNKPSNLLTRLFLGYLYASGLHPNLFNTATTSASNLLSTQNALLVGMISLLPIAEGAPIPPETEKANQVALKNLARVGAPISITTPLPDLYATPGTQFVENIYLAQYFQTSNPNANVDLSLQQINGNPIPSWLTLNMGPLSIINSFPIASAATTFDVIISGNLAYVASTSGLAIVNITNPNSPATVGSYSKSLTCASISLNGNYALIADCTNLYVFNVTIPSNIQLTATNTLYSTLGVSATSFSGNHLYIVSSALTIVDITNPLSPTLVSGAGLSNNPISIDISNNYAYTAYTPQDGHEIVPNYIEIFNVLNPSSATLVTEIQTNSQGGAIAQGNKLYLNINDNSVGIFDITQISNPVLLQTIFMGATVSSYVKFKIQGNYLYAFWGSAGLRVINIAGQTSQAVTSTYTSNSANNGIVTGNNVFVADGLAGLTAVNAAVRTLSGTPTLSDRGLILLGVNATDGSGDSIVETLSIHVGDIDILPIPNQQVYVGNTTMLSFNAGTFSFPQASFTYTAALVGGVPLPSFIGFNPSTRTFIFAPQSGNQNTYQIQVTANDGWGGVASTNFNLVVPDRPPYVVQPLSNQTAISGEPFSYTFASFPDTDLDIITYSAVLQGTSGLPGWISFNQATRTFSGTPFGRGNYPLMVTGNDGFGGTVSNSFTITVPPTPPLVLNPIGTQTASTGTPYSFTVNTNTFFDIDNDPMTYTANNVPPFLTFYNTTRTFTGTPQSGDVGSYLITIEADAFGGSASTSFNLNVVSAITTYPPVLEVQIPNLTERAGTAFSFTIGSDTFVDPQDSVLTYQAELVGNLPLPAGLNFDPATRTLSGTVLDPQILTILIRATNPSGAFALDTFTITVVESAPPIVLNALANGVANVNQKFTYHVPSNTFIDATNDPLTITVLQSNGNTLPSWLKWDETTSLLSGTPSAFDAGTIHTNKVNIDVWAKDGVGSTKTSFTIYIEGESFWTTFIKVGASLSSILATGFGLWEARAHLWNFFNREKYREANPHVTIIGSEFSYEVPDNYEKIGKIQTILGGKILMDLPSGLAFDKLTRTISGTTNINAETGRYRINVYDHYGYCIKEFDLIVKRNANDPNPPENPRFMTSNASASRWMSRRSSTHDDGDASGGGNGLSIMMRPFGSGKKDAT